MEVNNNIFRKQLTPRFDPVENPDNLKLKFVYWLTEKQLGKVISPLKVLYARFPAALNMLKELNGIDKHMTLENELIYLVKTYVSLVNGCAFCADIAKAGAISRNVPGGKFDHLAKFRESDRFSEKEKAALAYVEEVTRRKHVTDETFSALEKHFSEEEIVQLTILNAVENYFNMVNAPMNIGSDELCELELRKN